MLHAHLCWWRARGLRSGRAAHASWSGIGRFGLLITTLETRTIEWMMSMKMSRSTHAMTMLTHVLIADAAMSSQNSACMKSILMSSVMLDTLTESGDGGGGGRCGGSGGDSGPSAMT